MMKTVFDRPAALTDVPLHYCPGCTHGIVHRLVAEVIDELGVEGKTVGIAPVGCAVFAYNYFNCDMIEAAHGRAPAVATGVKRANPENIVFTYQGDGDLASIGTAETVHAAARNENITVIFINNAIYGMTGGQMSATTLVGQKSTTGVRKPELMGYPFNFAEMIGNLKAPGYVARGALYSPKYLMQAKEMIRKALRCQKEKGLYSYVELLSFCPTNWGVAPKDCLAYCEENVLPVFPVGEFKTCF